MNDTICTSHVLKSVITRAIAIQQYPIAANRSATAVGGLVSDNVWEREYYIVWYYRESLQCRVEMARNKIVATMQVLVFKRKCFALW